MKKRVLLIAALVAISTVGAGTANAVDVSSWSELKTNKDAENIIFQNDITATGEEFPMPLTITAATDQTIDGNYHSFSSQGKWIDQDTSPRWIDYSLSVAKTGGSLSFKNLGKFSDGSADNNTFSYTDLDGNTVYKNIETSVNSWKKDFLTITKPITVNITNSVFANNGKDTDAKLINVSGSGATLNVTDSIFYNNKIANVDGLISGNSNNVDRTRSLINTNILSYVLDFCRHNYFSL